MNDIIEVLLEKGILTVYDAGVYIMGENSQYSLMVYDAKQRIEGKVNEIWDNCRDVMILANDGDMLVKYNQFNILTMVHGDKVIDSSKIVSYFA
jgi:hypothetical protein